jgi:hypothetical protein
MANDRHEKHSDITKYIFMVVAPNLHCAVASSFVENVDQPDDSASQAHIVSQNEDMPYHLRGNSSSLNQHSERITKK